MGACGSKFNKRGTTEGREKEKENDFDDTMYGKKTHGNQSLQGTATPTDLGPVNSVL